MWRTLCMQRRWLILFQTCVCVWGLYWVMSTQTLYNLYQGIEARCQRGAVLPEWMRRNRKSFDCWACGVGRSSEDPCRLSNLCSDSGALLWREAEHQKEEEGGEMGHQGVSDNRHCGTTEAYAFVVTPPGGWGVKDFFTVIEMLKVAIYALHRYSARYPILVLLVEGVEQTQEWQSCPEVKNWLFEHPHLFKTIWVPDVLKLFSQINYKEPAKGEDKRKEEKNQTQIEEENSVQTVGLDAATRKARWSFYRKLSFFGIEGYDKIVFMDADTLTLRNIDILFETEPTPAFAMNHKQGTQTIFNSGVGVIKPNKAVFHHMLALAPSLPSYDLGDQGFLNSFYNGSWAQLPFPFNQIKWDIPDVLPVEYLYAKALLHFTGIKPPACPTTMDCNTNTHFMGQPLMDLWWAHHHWMIEEHFYSTQFRCPMTSHAGFTKTKPCQWQTAIAILLIGIIRLAQ